MACGSNVCKSLRNYLQNLMSILWLGEGESGCAEGIKMKIVSLFVSFLFGPSILT